jgi:hypothetical protein
MEKGRVFPVCGNTWRMLRETRFAPHFDFIGDFSRHYGMQPKFMLVQRICADARGCAKAYAKAWNVKRAIRCPS